MINVPAAGEGVLLAIESKGTSSLVQPSQLSYCFPNAYLLTFELLQDLGYAFPAVELQQQFSELEEVR